MKTKLAAVAIAAAALALAGCSIPSAPPSSQSAYTPAGPQAPDVTPTKVPIGTTPALTNLSQSQYLELMRTGPLAAGSDSDLIGLGQSVCSAIRTATDPSAVTDMIELTQKSRSDVTLADASDIVVWSIEAFCPDLSPLIPSN